MQLRMHGEIFGCSKNGKLKIANYKAFARKTFQKGDQAIEIKCI